MSVHEPQTAADLAATIRRSPLLDPALKRHWLRVLPHLAPRERERLGAILVVPAPTAPGYDGGRPD
jgi:hypothetical protein